MSSVNAFGNNNGSVTVYFSNTGAQGLFIKNQDYVHFEVGNISGIWVR